MIEFTRIDEYLLSKKGVTKHYKAEWAWTSYKVGGKMFAVFCTPSEKYDESVANHQLLTLKCDSLDGELLKEQYEDVLNGFYMDKRFWISLRLDGELTSEFVESQCDKAYQSVFSKLSKKLKAEILSL